MTPRNKMFDDLSQLMTNAMGVAQGARDEAETAMKSWMDRWLADRDFVTREEFDAVRMMAQKAREENAELKARLDALENKLTSIHSLPLPLCCSRTGQGAMYSITRDQSKSGRFG